MPTDTSTSSFRKYDSSDLLHIDISSPRKKRGTLSWDSSDHEEKAWRGRTQERVIAAINDTGGHLGSIFLIGHSWCVGPAIFLVWRIMIFIYMVVTLLVLYFKGAFITAEISMGIYVLQVFASFFTVLSSTLVCLFIRQEESFGMQEQVTWPQERLKETEKRKQLDKRGRRSTHRIKNRVTSSINLLALLFTQNCCVIVIFWNIVFWFKAQGAGSEISSRHANDLLLHFYNLIPVLHEIVIGCAVFRIVCYLPSTIAVVSVIAHIGITSFKDSSSRERAPGSAWSSLERKYHIIGWLLQMLLIYIMCCSFLSLAQRARQKLLRSL